jgi:Flp pilus assembly protein CpaB
MADLDTALRGEPELRRNGHKPGKRAVAPRRRSVPGGRAVLGGLLVAASVVGLYYASTRADSGPRQSWVVARRALPPGARLAADDLARVPIDLPPTVAARAFHEPSELVGATLIAPLAAGDLVQATAVVAKSSAPSSREVTFTVPRATLGASLEEGERVDVVATYGTGGDAFSAVVLRQATVLALNRGNTRVGDEGDVAVTVAVDDPNDAIALVHAAQVAKITLVRATGATPITGPPTLFRPPSPAAAPAPGR